MTGFVSGVRRWNPSEKRLESNWKRIFGTSNDARRKSALSGLRAMTVDVFERIDIVEYDMIRLYTDNVA